MAVAEQGDEEQGACMQVCPGVLQHTYVLKGSGPFIAHAYASVVLNAAEH